mgnify:CR=1 FL=1
MEFEILHPSCNLDTIFDNRGGIFTWLPKEPILEFNMLYFKPGKSRGFHYHPHFVEYILVVDGQGTMIVGSKKSADVKKIVHLSKGVCTRTEQNVYHTIYAITNMTIIAMLTKRWDDCDPPVVRLEK